MTLQQRPRFEQEITSEVRAAVRAYAREQSEMNARSLETAVAALRQARERSEAVDRWRGMPSRAGPKRTTQW